MIRKNIRIITVLLSCIVFGSLVANAQEKPDDQLALQYYTDKDYGKAIVLFEKLLDQNPSLFNYTYYLNCLLEQEEFAKAEKLARKQTKTFPGDPRYQVDLGYTYIRENQSPKGRKQYDECIRNIEPDQRKIQELAGAFLSRRETDYAIRAYQRGKELLGDTYTFGIELASVFMSTGNYDGMIS